MVDRLKCLHIPLGYKRHSKYRLNTQIHDVKFHTKLHATQTQHQHCKASETQTSAAYVMISLSKRTNESSIAGHFNVGALNVWWWAYIKSWRRAALPLSSSLSSREPFWSASSLSSFWKRRRGCCWPSHPSSLFSPEESGMTLAG